MAQEKAIQVLDANANELAASSSLILPVIMPDSDDEPVDAQESSERSGQVQATKRKRGRPRKNKLEDQGQSYGETGGEGITRGHQPAIVQQQSPIKRGRGRPRKNVEPSVDGGASGSVVVEKRGRGRPKKKVDDGSPLPQRETVVIGQVGGVTTAHTSTAIYNTVQQPAHNVATIISIDGRPLQVIPSTAVAAIDGSPQRPAPLSVVVSPSVDDANEWKAPSSASMMIETPLVHILPAATTPPLLLAEQPKALNQLPQCVVTNSAVDVNCVDRLALLDQAGNAHVIGEVSDEATEQKQQREDEKVSMEREKEEKRDNTIIETGGSAKEVLVEPAKKMEVPTKKPEALLPQEQTPVKRKRGRPPKSRTLPQSSNGVASTAEDSPGKGDTTSSSVKPLLNVSTTPEGTGEAVVKRKRGRPPKNRNQHPPTESSLHPSRQSSQPLAEAMAVANDNEDKSNNKRKRGRPPKASKLKGQAPEATGQVPVKRGRGRPRKYPIPVVAASGPFLPSVSGMTLPAPGQSKKTPSSTQKTASPQRQSKRRESQQEDDSKSVEVAPVKRKRGRPPKTPVKTNEGPPVKRGRGRPRKVPLPIEDETADTAQPQQEKDEQEKQPPQPRKVGRPRKRPMKSSDSEVAEKEKSTADATEMTEPLPKRKRGRPRKIAPVVITTTLQEPASLATLTDEPALTLSTSLLEKSEDDSMETEPQSLQISFSDSDSDHSEKQSSAIMALAQRVVPPTPTPPRQPSPLLDPTFEESYDEDSDPESK